MKRHRQPLDEKGDAKKVACVHVVIDASFCSMLFVDCMFVSTRFFYFIFCFLAHVFVSSARVFSGFCLISCYSVHGFECAWFQCACFHMFHVAFLCF